jgi:hypothetical protein
MTIESTEIKFSLTVREAQSLAAILKAVIDGKRKRIYFSSQFSELPFGMFDDVKELEMQLQNLLGVNND